MERATRHLRNAVIKNLSTKWPPPSSPGEPPHLRTGTLRNSISTQVTTEGDKIVGRVGTNVRYAVFLEVTQNRSFLVFTAEQEKERLKAILAGRADEQV